ncbi:MAG: aminotransferase class V-fold PLP-dependent enzyme [Planctomycetaceae bacterium]|nr:aminotransferase class V-fold PLP-dependent enzyme [Planctomycetaceae bacterium]
MVNKHFTSDLPTLLPPSSQECSRRQFLGRIGAGVGAISAAGLVVGEGQGAWAAGVQRPNWNSKSVKKEFGLQEGLVYMNNGTLGPVPNRVITASTNAWREMELNPAGNGFGTTLQQAEAVRQKAADYLECDLDEIVIMPNTTQSMNAVAQGLHLSEGDRVLTTDQEHPGGVRCWEYYEKRFGVGIDRAVIPTPPESEEEIVDLLAAQITPKTKVISVAHVTTTTGLVLPIAKIAELAESNNCILCVDGAQGPGAMNINVRELNCDTYATSAHKWMLAPKGTGLLYINKRAAEKVDSLRLQDGYRYYTATSGTLDMPAAIGLGASIDFLTEIGKPRIEEWSLYLREMMYEKFLHMPKVTIFSPEAGTMASPLVTVGCEGMTGGDIAAALGKQDIVVKVVPYGNRISTHLYNDEEDVEKVVSAIKQLLG